MKLNSQLYSLLFNNLSPSKAEFQEVTKLQIQLVENGVAVSNLVKAIESIKQKQAERQFTPLSRLDQLKQLSTSSAKLYNWNIIVDSLNSLGISHNIVGEFKQHILTGDAGVIEKILQEIFQQYLVLAQQKPYLARKRSNTTDLRQVTPTQQKTKQLESDQKQYRIRNTSIHNSINDSALANNQSNVSNNQSAVLKQPTSQKQVDLSNIPKDPNQAESALEFFISTICKNLQVNSKQAASLFADNNKYLAHIVAKGVQGMYEPVVNYYQEVFSNLSKLIGLLDEKSILFVLQCLKPGMVSKSTDVALNAVKVLIQISQELKIRKLTSLVEQSYNWFIEQGGLSMTFLGLKRHPGLGDEFVGLIIEYTRMHFLELFTYTIKTIVLVEGERIQLIDSIFYQLTQRKQIKEEVCYYIYNTILKSFSHQVQLMIGQTYASNLYQLTIIKYVQQVKNNLLHIIELLCSIWQNYEQISTLDDKNLKILNLIKEYSKSQSQSVSIFALHQLFQMLKYFVAIKHQMGPIIYKSLALLLVDSYANTDLRVFILSNFEQLFIGGSNIPLSVVIEPLVRQCQNQPYVCLSVFKFVSVIVELHDSNLMVRSIIQLLDMLARLTLYDIIHYRVVQDLMIKLLVRGLSSQEALPSVVEFVSKYVKVALSVYFSSIKTMKKDKSQQYKQNDALLEGQKRGQIIETIKSIILLMNDEINQKIKILVVHTNLQYKEQYRKISKGLNSILSELGDPDKILQQYEAQKAQVQKEDQLQDSIVTKNLQSSQIHSSKKPNTQKLTKEEQYHLASLRMPKQADPKVLQELEDAKKSFQQKQQQQVDYLESSQLSIARQKVQLRKQLEKRSIEQGVATKNQKNVEANLLLPDGQRERDLRTEKKHGLTVIEIIDLREEEERDKWLVDVWLVRSNKVLRWLFSKFANSGFKGQQPTSFDGLQRQLNYINIAEIRKMLQEFELDTRITKEEVQSLAREVHVRILNERTDLKAFDFLGFQHFFVQLTIVLSGRPPYNSKHTPPFQCIQQILTYMRNVMASRKQSTALFDDPDSQYFSQSDIIKEYNLKLLEDSSFPIPDGFRKVATPEVTFNYSLVQTLDIPEGSKICYQIVDELMQTVATSLVEPTTEKSIIWKAKPNMFGYIESKLQNEKAPIYDKILNKNQISQRNFSQGPQQKRRVLEIEPKRELTMGLKIGISKYNFRDRPLAEQVANLIEDMIYSVENNRPTMQRSLQIQNKAQEQKQIDIQMEQRKEEQREKKRQERQELLKEKLEQEKKLYEEKIKETNEKLKQDSEEQKKQEKLKEKKKQEYLDVQRIKLKESQEKKQSDFIKQQEDQKQQKIEEIKQKKKEFLQFNQEKLIQFKQDQIDDKLQKEKDVKKQEVDEQKKKQKLEQDILEFKKLDQERKLKEKESHQKIIDRYQANEYQEILKIYNFQLYGLFDFLLKETFQPIGKPCARDQITLTTFTWFADHFKLWPEILNKYDVITIFRTLTRDKTIVDHVPIGMNFNDFTQALYRLSIKGKKIFNLIGDKIKKGEATKQNVDDIVDKEGNQRTGNEDQLQINEEDKQEEEVGNQYEEDEQQLKEENDKKNEEKSKQKDLEIEKAKEEEEEQQKPRENQENEQKEQQNEEDGQDVFEKNQGSDEKFKSGKKQSYRKEKERKLKEQKEKERKEQEKKKPKPKPIDPLQAQLLIDNYGNIDEATPLTLEALIVYLNLPDDKNKLELRFRGILEEGKKPNKKRKASIYLFLITKDLDKKLQESKFDDLVA